MLRGGAGDVLHDLGADRRYDVLLVVDSRCAGGPGSAATVAGGVMVSSIARVWGSRLLPGRGKTVYTLICHRADETLFDS